MPTDMHQGRRENFGHHYQSFQQFQGPADWEAYKHAIFNAYPGLTLDEWWTSDNFDNLCATLASQPITSIVDFAAFHWKISTAGYSWIKSN